MTFTLYVECNTLILARVIYLIVDVFGLLG